MINIIFYYYPNIIRSKMQAEQSILDRIQRRQLKRYGPLLLEWKIFVDQTRYTSGHRTVGGEEEDCNYHGRNQVTDLMRSRNLEEDMAEDRHLWRLGVYERLLAV